MLRQKADIDSRHVGLKTIIEPRSVQPEGSHREKHIGFLKATTEPRPVEFAGNNRTLTVPDRNTEAKHAMIEANTEQNPIGHDSNILESSCRTKSCWT